jgi:hypothetical protein
VIEKPFEATSLGDELEAIYQRFIASSVAIAQD